MNKVLAARLRELAANNPERESLEALAMIATRRSIANGTVHADVSNEKDAPLARFEPSSPWPTLDLAGARELRDWLDAFILVFGNDGGQS